jgi:hypothetical protein
MNKTSICSVVSLEIVDYSKKTDAEQVEIRSLFDGFINHAVIDIPQDDRAIISMGSGAAIACSGPLEDALEDALFISITIRDEILKNNTHSATPLYVQFGINLGAVRVVKNTIVGEGLDEAQRIMSFAEPNQILVSHVYYEMAAKLTQEIAQMFEKYEMHAHEHDVYAVRLLKEAAAEESPSIPTDSLETGQAIASNINWMYVGSGLLVLAAFFVLGKLVTTPTEPTITLVQPAVVEKQPAAAEASAKPDAEPIAATEPAIPDEAKKEEPKKAKVAQKKTAQKAAAENKAPANTAAKPAESKAEKSAAKDKSSWQSFKDSVTSGTERKCTQAEIAMNQCVK